MKSLLLTFDYELFLGDRSGYVDKCLLEPTHRLQKIAKRLNCKLVFFVDTIYLLKMQEKRNQFSAINYDFVQIVKQLRSLVSDGHYIFPHLHAHWHDANYLEDINQWDLSNIQYYRFHNLPLNQQQHYFLNSINFLDQIVENKYPIDSYRAGGWSIQPFAAFKPFFEKYNIVYDWSAVPGKYVVSTAHCFDFRNIVPTLTHFNFLEEVDTSNTAGPFVELPISVLKLSRREVWLNFKFSALIQKFYPFKLSGSTVNSQTIVDQTNLPENRKLYLASFERITPLLFFKMLYQLKRTGHLHTIGHPKMLSPFDLTMFAFWLSIVKFFIPITTDYKQFLP